NCVKEGGSGRNLVVAPDHQMHLMCTSRAEEYFHSGAVRPGFKACELHLGAATAGRGGVRAKFQDAFDHAHFQKSSSGYRMGDAMAPAR
ncbi:MAG: hypothetical protein AB7K04_08125, partial [Pseudorhodoplanes sp.]